MSYTFHPASVARAVGSRDPEVARLLAEWQDIADGDPRDVDVTAALAKLVNLRTERYDLDCWDQRRRRVCVDEKTVCTAQNSHLKWQPRPASTSPMGR